MNERPANHRYYQSCHGQWRTQLDLRITDHAAFRAAPMSAFDRLRIRLMVLLPRLIGPLWLETSVDYESAGAEGRVVHTTMVRKWGISFLRSVERIELDPDGRKISVQGEQRMWPIPWQRRVIEGTAVVDSTARSATYALTWFGSALRQETLLEEDRVTITQTTPWSHGVQALVRRGSPSEPKGG